MLDAMAEPQSVNRRPKWGPWVAGGALGILAGAAIGWAGSVVFAPGDDLLEETPYTYIELTDGEVGSSISLNAVAAWKAMPAGTNQSSGTVTSVDLAGGAAVNGGEVLYRVGLRPVVVAAGSVPAFRALEIGTNGEDVQQLQAFLASEELYSGPQDGDFGWRTAQAVHEWQAQLSVEDDGVVRLGDLVFVPQLPARLALDPKVIYRGAALGGGEQAISGLAPEPSFEIPVASAQAALIPVGTSVQISAGDASWSAIVSEQTPANEGDEVRLALVGPNGGSICGDACAEIPTDGQSRFPSEVVTQAPVRGVVAPTAALISSPDGEVGVVDQDGVTHKVSVLASAKGMSVVEGVSAGTRVRIPASAESR